MIIFIQGVLGTVTQCMNYLTLQSIQQNMVCTMPIRSGTEHITVPITETFQFWNRTKAVEWSNLQSVARFLTTSRRLHGRSKDVPFLWNSSAVFNKTAMASTGTVNCAHIKLNVNNLETADEKDVYIIYKSSEQTDYIYAC